MLIDVMTDDDLESLVLSCPSSHVLMMIESFLGSASQKSASGPIDGALFGPLEDSRDPSESPQQTVESSSMVYDPPNPEAYEEASMSLGGTPPPVGQSYHQVDESPVGLQANSPVSVIRDESIEWSSQDDSPVKPEEEKRKTHAERVRVADQRQHYSFESEESLENISELDAGQDSFSQAGGEDKENLQGLEDMVHRLTLGVAADKKVNDQERKRKKKAIKISEWLEQRNIEDAKAGAIVVYSAGCADEVRNAILCDALAQAQSALKTASKETGDFEEEEEEEDSFIDGNDIPVPENSGNVLVVTSKAAIAGWGDVVDTVGGHLRVVDYSVSLAKRRGLRISNHSADVVLTTWDVLKSKEVHIRGVECSYCHGQRWASIVVDYHTNRTPSAKNQAGRAIEALKSMVGSKHGSRQAKVRTSLVQIDDGGNSRLDPFLPRISTLGGLKGTLSEAYHDARQPT